MIYDNNHRIYMGPGVYPGLAEAVAAAGIAIECQNGTWYASDAVAAQVIIDNFTVTQAVAPLIPVVKELARQKILAFLPEWKQSNYNARLNELNEARFTRALTGAELAEIEAMRAAWLRAKAIRSASDIHEANLRSLSTFAAVATYDVKTGWPEG
jgi:hypothetical protein